MSTAVFFWERLDAPGHDTCRLAPWEDGHLLSGCAVFMAGRHACELRYEVQADADFATRKARVEGFIGARPVDVRIAVTRQGRWRIDGEPQPALAGCVDVDFGFTPATNLLPLRRLGLRVGQAADAPAAWMDFPRPRFTVLPQRYERLSKDIYGYASPSAGYRGELRVSKEGAVTDYPGLFRMVRSGSRRAA